MCCVYVAVCRFYAPHHRRHQAYNATASFGFYEFCGGYFARMCVCVHGKPIDVLVYFGFTYALAATAAYILRLHTTCTM